MDAIVASEWTMLIGCQEYARYETRLPRRKYEVDGVLLTAEPRLKKLPRFAEGR